MSKKRTLTLVLVLLPLAIGGAVIATVAKGSRSTEIAADPAAQAPGSEPTTVTQSEGLAAPLPALPFDASMPRENAPAANDEKSAPKSGEAPLVIESDEASSEPMYASTASSAPAGDAPIMLADAGLQSHSALYRLSGRARGGGGGGGGGDAIGDDGAGDDTTAPAGTAPNDNSKGNAGPGKGPDQGPPGSDDDDDSTEPDAGDEPPPEEPPPYFPPEEPKPPVQVPEPAPLALFGLGLLACALARKKAKARL